MTRADAETLIIQSHAKFRQAIEPIGSTLRVIVANALRDLAHDVMPVDMARSMALEDVADMVQPSTTFRSVPAVATHVSPRARGDGSGT